MTVALSDLGLAIKRVQHKHHRALDGRLARLGTTLVQWDALRHIDRHPDSSSHQLAMLTFQTDQSFGTLATRLDERGLIARVAGPGRAILHRLTPAGQKLLHAGHAIFEAVLVESFAPLAPRQRDALYALLVPLVPADPNELDPDTDDKPAKSRTPRARR